MSDYNPSTDENTLQQIAQIRETAALPNPVTKWEYRLSRSSFYALMSHMPEDFKLRHPAEFDYALEIALRAPSKVERLQTLLYTRPMMWLKQNHLDECAKSITKLVAKIDKYDLPEVATLLLSGRFIKDLAYNHPELYANFFMEVVGRMDDEDSRKFAKVELADESSSLYSVIPILRLHLPPLALVIPPSGVHEPKIVNSDFSKELSDTARLALRGIFSAEAYAAARQNHYRESAWFDGYAELLSLKHS